MEGRKRHGAGEGLGLIDAATFVVGGEEEAVLAIEDFRDVHRAAYHETELIQAEGRDGLGRGIEEVLGIERGVAQEFEDRAVQYVSAGFEIHVDNAKASAVGRGSGTGLNFELLNHVDS